MPGGKYLVVEGNDGTGKSTQVELLGEFLNSQGIETFIIHEPDGPGISTEIRKLIKNGIFDRQPITNLLLFTASRHEIWQQAKRELAAGKWVLSARNYFSTIAFQGYGEGLDVDTITETTRLYTDEHYMNPDYAFVLRLSDKNERKSRINGRGAIANPDTFESRGDDFQSKVEAGYDAISEDYDVVVLDASQPIDDVQQEIRKRLKL